MAVVEKTIFREYDIRGKVDDEEINENSTELIGKGFGTILVRRGVRECVVGFDARSYSEKLKNALVKGITSTGVDVVEIGQVTSPITYFAQYHLNIKGCAMLTASHNPNGWSGFKLGYDFSMTLVTEDVKELHRIIREDDYEEGNGSVRVYEKDIVQDYTDTVLKKIELKRKLKVVVNARNGTAGPIVPDILRRAGCDVVEQFCNVDTSFPNGNPNPSLDDMLEELGELVRKEGADIGFAYDGDGDRIGMVDENGSFIYPDKILILLSRLILQKRPGAKVVFDVKCSQALVDDIENHGGEPVMWKTGHSYIKEKVHNLSAALGGERSGHIFIAEGYYGFDDAVFASLKVLEYLSQEEGTVSSVMESIPKYHSSPVIHAPCPDEVKYDVMERVLTHLKERFDRVIDINGARVVFEDGWGLIRPSSNLPVMVFVFEGKTPEKLKEIENIFRKEMEMFPEISKEWKNG
jgi:phosphomannomutase/phosphoglucomutase